MVKRRRRVLLAKMGTDGHDLGLKFVAATLRQAGMEVVYLGPYQTPEKVFNTAVQEWVDVIGIGSLSGEYTTFVPKLIELLREKGLDGTIKVVLGGLIAKEDTGMLRGMGVTHILSPGAASQEIVEAISTPLKRERPGKRSTGKAAAR